jgi:hypothetical protein
MAHRFEHRFPSLSVAFSRLDLPRVHTLIGWRGGARITGRLGSRPIWNPATGDKTNIDGITRGNFRLHPMGPRRLSEGCVTVVNQYDFDRLEKFLRSQKPSLPVPRTDLKACGTLEIK